MTTNATAAYGTLLKMGDGGAPEVFATVAEITSSPAMPEISAKMEDATSHDSGGWEESIPTLLSGGEPSFKVNWLPTAATHNETTGFYAALINRTRKNWKVVLPNGAKTFSFSAFVSSFKPDAQLNGKLSGEVKLKITGAISVG